MERTCVTPSKVSSLDSIMMVWKYWTWQMRTTPILKQIEVSGWLEKSHQSCEQSPCHLKCLPLSWKPPLWWLLPQPAKLVLPPAFGLPVGSCIRRGAAITWTSARMGYQHHRWRISLLCHSVSPGTWDLSLYLNHKVKLLPQKWLKKHTCVCLYVCACCYSSDAYIVSF